MENEEFLLRLSTEKMPFGKYKGRLLIDIPEHYIMWMARQGFKNDSLGKMLSTIYEIRLNGLEYLLKPFREGKK